MTLQYPVKGTQTKPSSRVYQYPRLPRQGVEPGRTVRTIAGSAVGQKYIQGKSATDLEWNTWQGLKRAGWRDEELKFQKGFLGGRFFKGGVVADIVVETKPLPTVIFVNSEYWHMGQMSSDDIIDMIRFDQELGAYFNPPLYLFQPDVISEDAAFDTIMREIGYR